VDVQSLSTTKFDLEFEGELVQQDPSPVWSPDNQKIIFFVSHANRINEFGGLSAGYLYALDLKNGQATIISGLHPIENSSPIAAFP
jgi:hypothetical protein